MDTKNVDEIVKKLTALLPEGATAFRQDLENNFRAVLQSGLEKLELVTRREFDVQAALLARTREKLEALEARLAQLHEEKPKH